MSDYEKWNWPNCWRVTFILLMLAFFFGVVMDWTTVGKMFAFFGGVSLILMVVIRFEDVYNFFDN